jgi:serine/threonine protein kinase
MDEPPGSAHVVDRVGIGRARERDVTLEVGSRIGPYEVVERLGAGGMGVVFRARDSRLARDVAIKLLPPDTLHDASARARFRREALALASLSHPGIATLFDVLEVDGESYLVMECVEGESLASRLARGPIPVGEAISVAAQIADALADAHEHGIVHRDLKPANVMLTSRGRVKVLDFGIAKILEAAGDASMRTTASQTQGAIGTLLYMSPEQALGETVDGRSDVWSLGVLLAEMLLGAPPFQGAGTLGLLNAIATDPPPSLRGRADVSPELERIVDRALAKRPEQRYASAAAMRDELAALLASGEPRPASRTTDRRSARPWLLAGAVTLALLGTGAWALHRSERRQWARETALPEATRLAVDHPLAAFALLREAERYLPGDTAMTALARTTTRDVTVRSEPEGATVELQDYLEPNGAWYRVGTTPIARATIPAGYLRWRLTARGAPPTVVAPETRDTLRFALDSARRAPAGMVYAGGRMWADFIAFVGWVGPYALPPFYIDRFEVTNREYQRFVDAGGYARREYWREPFDGGGRVIAWEEAMRRLRDSTDRPGPSTWKGGHFPEGYGDYPVTGVSWYEAAAYAAWSGKSLPTMAQWYYAAPPNDASFTVRMSNISRERLAPAGATPGVGPFGTYDMAGNAREWISNPVGGNRRMILGGSWSSPTYLYSEPEALSPFDRSAANGFRCVRNIGPVPPQALAEIRPLERDFARFVPASDAVFDAYRLLYRYDRGPLDAHVETVKQRSPDWREERVTIATAYDGSRMPVYLFLPTHARPPFQTVVFSPSARVMFLTNSGVLGDTSFFDYVVQSGRAVAYPIYQGTYERRLQGWLPGASQAMKLTVQRYQDLARTLDYLDTRSDIDRSRIAYLGVSMGAAEGVIYTTLLQNRLKTDVLLDGGFFLDAPTPGRDQADFAPRLKLPVLMVNGRYDFSFSLDRAQRPLFRMLGTPPQDKRHVILDTPHDVRARRADLIAAVVPWLDRYLGTVSGR